MSGLISGTEAKLAWANGEQLQDMSLLSPLQEQSND